MRLTMNSILFTLHPSLTSHRCNAIGSQCGNGIVDAKRHRQNADPDDHQGHGLSYGGYSFGLPLAPLPAHLGHIGYDPLKVARYSRSLDQTHNVSREKPITSAQEGVV